MWEMLVICASNYSSVLFIPTYLRDNKLLPYDSKMKSLTELFYGKRIGSALKFVLKAASQN